MNLLHVILVSGWLGFSAQAQGILPGEPDPNSGPSDSRGETLLDDRHACPKGTKRYQRMKCGDPNQKQDCQNFSPVLDCLKRPQKIQCKKPKVPVPVYRCD